MRAAKAASSTADAGGVLPVPCFVLLVGRKGSGKSHLARVLWASYGGHRLCVDPTGDVARLYAGDGRYRVVNGGPAPGRWPERDDEPRASIIFVPDRSQPDWLGSTDQWIRLAYDRGKVCVWVDEVGLITRSQSCPPHFANALHTGRHRDLSLIMCGPRPVNIDPLALGQADLIYVFDLPQPSDRKRIADTAGVDTRTLDLGVRQLGPHEHLRIDVAQPSGSDDRLLHMEALPG